MPIVKMVEENPSIDSKPTKENASDQHQRSVMEIDPIHRFNWRKQC